MRSALMLSLLIVLAGCATEIAQLAPGAEKVRILKGDLEPGARALGELRCEYGMNFHTVADNIAGCRNSLRNQARRLGAAFVVVEAEQLGSGSCGNCVSMFGTAYGP